MRKEIDWEKIRGLETNKAARTEAINRRRQPFHTTIDPQLQFVVMEYIKKENVSLSQIIESALLAFLREKGIEVKILFPATKLRRP